MRKIIITAGALLLSTQIAASPLQCPQNNPQCNQKAIDKRLLAALNDGHRRAVHLNKKTGEFDIVYGGKDVSRISLTLDQIKELNKPVKIA